MCMDSQSVGVPSLHPRAGAECKLIIFCVGPFFLMATASVSYEKSFTFLYFILYSVFFLAPSGHKQGTQEERSIESIDVTTSEPPLPARGRAFCWFS